MSNSTPSPPGNGSVVEPAGARPALPANPAAVYLANLSSASRPTMEVALRSLAQLLPEALRSAEDLGSERYLGHDWARLRRADTLQIRAQLQERYAPATANKLLTALRGVLRTATQLGQIDDEAATQAMDLPPFPERLVQHRRTLVPDERQALLQVCAADPTPAGARDAALLLLIEEVGLRRAEIVALDLDDFDVEAGRLKVRSGRRGARLVALPEATLQALRHWLAVRGLVPGPLLYGLAKGGRLVVRRLAPQAVAVICAARAAEAALSPFTPEDLRRTFLLNGPAHIPAH